MREFPPLHHPAFNHALTELSVARNVRAIWTFE
jgi:hypothetical protein